MQFENSSFAIHSKITMRGNESFANVGTLTISFLLIPLLQIGLYILISASSSGADIALISYKASLLSSGICMIEAVNATFAYERRVGMISYFAVLGRIRAVLILGRLAPIMSLSFSIIVVEVIAMYFLDPLFNVSRISLFLISGIITIFIGALIGISIGLLSLYTKDPFIFSNLYIFFIITFSGIFGHFPQDRNMIFLLSHFSPFSHVIVLFNTVDSHNLKLTSIAKNLSLGVTVASASFIFSYIAYRFMRTRRRHGFEYFD